MKFTTILFLAATAITSVVASPDLTADTDLLKREVEPVPARCKNHCIGKTHCECFGPGPDDCECVSNGIGNRVRRTVVRRSCSVSCRGVCMCYPNGGACVCTRG